MKGEPPREPGHRASIFPNPVVPNSVYNGDSALFHMGTLSQTGPRSGQVHQTDSKTVRDFLRILLPRKDRKKWVDKIVQNVSKLTGMDTSLGAIIPCPRQVDKPNFPCVES
jgi:hypothetical protein